MTTIASGFHPSFDALSKYADTSDVDRARTRVGRHVAVCARCREIVAEVQAMGDAARAIELPGAPDGLWSRIAKGVADEGVESAERQRDERVVSVPTGRDVDRGEADIGREPKHRDGDWQRRAALGIVVVAVLGVAVVAGSLRSLGAATPSRLSLSSAFIAPGGRVLARYRPIAALASESTLTVWARYESATAARDYDPALVRAGTLRRVSPQEYTGTVGLPVGALVGFFAVGDSSGRVMDRSRDRPRFLGAVLAADSGGRPSFEALVTLLGRYRDRLEGVDLARAADAMERHYPSRPETWMLTYPIAHRGVVRDVVKRFESGERVYAGWHDRLATMPALSIEVEQMMANMGNELMDTTRFEFWMKRLMADHPDEIREQRMWLSQVGRLPVDSGPPVSAADLRRGHLEIAATNPRWVLSGGTQTWLRDTSIMPELERLLQRDLAALRDSVGVPTVWGTPASMAERLAMRKGAIRTRLAAIQLLRGETLAATESLDVVVRDVEARPGCPMPETMRWRAEAELRLGQTDAARDDLAYVATTESWQVAAVGDSVPQLLGPRYSAESWIKAKEAAKERHRICFAAARERRRAENRQDAPLP